MNYGRFSSFIFLTTNCAEFLKGLRSVLLGPRDMFGGSSQRVSGRPCNLFQNYSQRNFRASICSVCDRCSRLSSSNRFWSLETLRRGSDTRRSTMIFVFCMTVWGKVEYAHVEFQDGKRVFFFAVVRWSVPMALELRFSCFSRCLWRDPKLGIRCYWC